ncbi:GatB YqeY domain-containing protein [Marasmius fiardii PR-910]|nr:GatB YqeY domain-containing protein [Marasmius fiardii PR-910]
MASRFSAWYLTARTFSSSATRKSDNDIRQVLTSRIKDALKSKNQIASTTLRSVLSQVNAADKTSKAGPITSSVILGIMRKAHAQRVEAANTFTTNSRPDLAEKELKEAAILNEFLPPLLTPEQIDNHLHEILSTLPPDQQKSPKAVGAIFKIFYSKVDRSSVDTDLVKNRLNGILSTDTT